MSIAIAQAQRHCYIRAMFGDKCYCYARPRGLLWAG